MKSKRQVKIYLDEKTIIDGVIAAIDSDRDIAALSVNREIEPLYSIYYKPYSGYWVMAVGSPFAMDGTTTFGNIINQEGDKIFTSASLNKGNSGGPLVDNEGMVVGINTGYRAVAQNLNWAIDINALCYKIAICESDTGLLHPIK
jgi:serine protease Do